MASDGETWHIRLVHRKMSTNRHIGSCTPDKANSAYLGFLMAFMMVMAVGM
jgi:hypothetical protein